MDIYGIILVVVLFVAFVFFILASAAIVWNRPGWTVLFGSLAVLLAPLCFRSITAVIASIVAMLLVWAAVYRIMNRHWFVMDWKA